MLYVPAVTAHVRTRTSHVQRYTVVNVKKRIEGKASCRIRGLCEFAYMIYDTFEIVSALLAIRFVIFHATAGDAMEHR